MNKENKEIIENYRNELIKIINNEELNNFIQKLAAKLIDCTLRENKILICGNGGSAANSLHFENDIVTINKEIVYTEENNKEREILRPNIISLNANISTLTCLANDIGYDKIFMQLIESYGKKNDILIVLSGSGNSLNVVNALKVAKRKGLETFAIVGFDGGISKKISKYTYHAKTNDMQVAEDIQLFICHATMKILNKWKKYE